MLWPARCFYQDRLGTIVPIDKCVASKSNTFMDFLLVLPDLGSWDPHFFGLVYWGLAPRQQPGSGPDLGMGKMDSWPGASTKRGLHIFHEKKIAQTVLENVHSVNWNSLRTDSVLQCVLIGSVIWPWWVLNMTFSENLTSTNWSRTLQGSCLVKCLVGKYMYVLYSCYDWSWLTCLLPYSDSFYLKKITLWMTVTMSCCLVTF